MGLSKSVIEIYFVIEIELDYGSQPAPGELTFTATITPKHHDEKQ
jgi:hypothetical protein